MKYVYRLKNNLIRAYGPLEFRSEDFKTYSRQLHDFCILYPQKAIEQFLNVTTIELVGEYDEESGKIAFYNADQSASMTYNMQEAWEQLRALKEQVNGNGQN